MSDIRELKRTVAVRFFLALSGLGLVFFLPAGTLRFWEAWAYLAILFVPMVMVLVHFLKRDPEVLERRMRTREKEGTQRIFVLAGTLLFLAGLLLVGFDRRWGWSAVPTALVVAADIIVLAGYGIFVLVLRANRYLSRTVEVDAGQKIVTNGPYAVVRHPMYAGILLLYLSTPIALGSVWALIPFVILAALFPVRILNEEKVLLREMPEYEGYMAKTRFRLIPGIW